MVETEKDTKVEPSFLRKRIERFMARVESRSEVRPRRTITLRRPPETPPRPIWRQLLFLGKTSPAIAYTVVVLIVLELVGIIIAPAILPDNVYLSMYLSGVEKEKTHLHLDGGDPHYIRDDLLGWRNVPNANDGKYVLDENGARVTHPITAEPELPNRVLFLGSSLVNGAPHVENWETISAYVEDSLTESINFGSMRHTLDQEYLAYKHRLHEYQANIVVIGLPAEPTEGLDNQYLPFRAVGAHGMPFLKPRFELEGDQLTLLPLPPRQLHEDYLNSPELCGFLSETDECYVEFDRYKRFQVLPVSAAFHHVFQRSRNLSRLIWRDRESVPLLKALMSATVEECRAHGATPVFLVLPDLQTTAPGGWRSYLPDHYGQLLAELRSEGFEIVDAREILRQSERPMWELYHSDAYHYTPVGNQTIAASLKNHIQPYFKTTD